MRKHLPSLWVTWTSSSQTIDAKLQAKSFVKCSSSEKNIRDWWSEKDILFLDAVVSEADFNLHREGKSRFKRTRESMSPSITCCWQKVAFSLHFLLSLTQLLSLDLFLYLTSVYFHISDVFSTSYRQAWTTWQEKRKLTINVVIQVDE